MTDNKNESTREREIGASEKMREYEEGKKESMRIMIFRNLETN